MQFRLRESHPPSHVTDWSGDHMIYKKYFISTFARTMAPILARYDLNWVDHNHRVTWLIYDVITLYPHIVASPVSQSQWPSNLVGLWVRVKRPHLLFQVTCRSLDRVLFENHHVATNARPQNSDGDTKHTHRSKAFFLFLKYSYDILWYDLIHIDIHHFKDI